MKKTIQVTIVKEIEIELTAAFFGKLTQEQYLSEYGKYFHQVAGMDDVFKYAARMVAINGPGEYEALGQTGSIHAINQSALSVKFNELSEEIEEEILNGGAS